MTFRLSLLLLGTSFLQISCKEEVRRASITEKSPEEEEKENEDASFRIPLGAVLSDVEWPYYGKDHQQISLLTAEEMTVEGPNLDLEPKLDPTKPRRMKARGLKIWLFDKAGKVSTTTTIPEGTYHIRKKQLKTEGNLVIREGNDLSTVRPKFVAHSNGGIFTLKTGQALLMGPVAARFDLPQEDKTTMNLLPIFPLTAAIQMLVAAPPEIDPKHMAEFERLVAPRIIPHVDPDDELADIRLANEELAKRVAEYLRVVGKTQLLTQVAADQPAKEVDPLANLMKAGPNDLTIRCDEKVYLDSEALEGVFFGNTVVKGKGVTMSCNQDLKIIFSAPEPEPKKKEEAGKEKKKDDKGPLSSFGGFGDIKFITANGKVRVRGLTKGQEFFLGGDSAVFKNESDPKNPKNEGTITLRGDKLAFLRRAPGDKEGKKGAVQLVSISKNAYAIVHIKETAPGKSDLTVQLSESGWDFRLRPEEKAK
jgi:hypothetical protein